MKIQGKINQRNRVRPGIWSFGRRDLYRVSGAAGMATGLIFLAAMISLLISILQPGLSGSSWLSFQSIWLLVILKLHAGSTGVHIELLHGLNFLDIAILAFAGTMCLGLQAALKQTSKVWRFIVAIQPFLGIAIFVATKNAGRSAVMGAVLVMSIIMLRSRIFAKVTALVGILASVLLLAGDFSAGVIHPSFIVATLVGIGCVSLMIWFFLAAQSLFELGKSEPVYLK